MELHAKVKQETASSDASSVAMNLETALIDVKLEPVLTDEMIIKSEFALNPNSSSFEAKPLKEGIKYTDFDRHSFEAHFDMDIKSEIANITDCKARPSINSEIDETVSSFLPQVEESFECKECCKTVLKKDWRRHIYSHIEKRISCKLCNYETKYESCLQRHMLVHTGEKPFKCDICGYRTSHKNNLRVHAVKHNEDKPYACEICDHNALSQSLLKQHMTVHTGEKLFTCEICNFTTSTRRNLRLHMRRHIEEKPFACGICDYRTTSKPILNQHMRVHTGEKPFACELCEYKSTQKGALNRHMRVHTGEKPFICQICDYRASHKGNLRLHMTKHM